MGSKSDMADDGEGRRGPRRSAASASRSASCPRTATPTRSPTTASNARMRGLRVIIAGAGLSAALPGVAAAHTDLPVIGVPLSSRLSAAGGLDAILSVVQMPPGVPGRLRRPGQRANADLAARILGRLAASLRTASIARRDRPLHPPRDRRDLDRRGAHGGVAPRRGRGLRGDGRADAEADLEAIRARDVHRRGGPGARARSPTTTSPRSSTCSRRAPGPAGRWIHFGLTSSDVLDTALALQLQAAGEIVVAGARELVAALADAGARARRHRLRRAHPRRPRRADDVRHQARRLRLRGAPQRRAPRARVRAGARRARSAAPSAPTRRTRPDFEGRVLARLGLERETVSTQVVPRDRHAELLQAIALAGAGLERLATEIRHLQRTEVREAEEPFRAGQQKGSSAMPHKRNPITTERITGPGARAARQRAGRASRTSRCGTSATSRTPAPSA